MYTKPTLNLLGNATTLVQSIKVCGAELDVMDPHHQTEELAADEE